MLVAGSGNTESDTRGAVKNHEATGLNLRQSAIPEMKIVEPGERSSCLVAVW